MASRPVSKGMRILGALFGLTAASDLWQIVGTAIGWNDEPYLILVIHGVLFFLAAAASIALWRARQWSVGAVVLWGVCTSAFIVALGPILALGSAERSGLWIGAAAVLIVALVIAAYARRQVRGPVPGAPAA